MYSIVSEDNKEKNRAKRVNKSIILKGKDDENDDNIKFKVYEFVLLKKNSETHSEKKSKQIA